MHRFRKRLCVAIARHRLKFISGARDVGQAQNLHGGRRTGSANLLSLVADQGLDAAPVLSADHIVADLQRAALHQYTCRRPHAGLHLRLHNEPACGLVRVRLKLEHFGFQQDALKQPVDPLARFGTHRTATDRAAPLFYHDVVFLQLLLQAVRVGGS